MNSKAPIIRNIPLLPFEKWKQTMLFYKSWNNTRWLIFEIPQRMLDFHESLNLPLFFSVLTLQHEWYL